MSRMLNGRIFGWKDCIGNFTQEARLSGKVVKARNKTDRNGSILKYISVYPPARPDQITLQYSQRYLEICER